MASQLTRMAFAAPKMVRSYASASQIKAPLTLFGLDGRYATALYTAAAKENCLDAVEKELKQVQSVVAKDKSVQALLENPTLNRTTKKQGVQQLLKAGKYSKVTSNLFVTLAENGRLAETQKVIVAYQELMSAHRNELNVVITSAKELDKSTLNKVADALSKGTVAEGKKLIVTNKVKPAILGGLTVEFGDKTIDLSVASKVAKLNKLISDSV
ncbi:OSCP/delta subunit of ATPase [Umbelopsis sp. PMI_123]|nr:OSCP/delta subunit of ATPase [Umbelopsis sp. PMI_123]